MTTALDIITRSVRQLGVIGKGEALDSSDASDGLMALNALMGSLSNTPAVYANAEDTIPLTGGVSSITVGPTGTFVTGRPLIVLESSYITNGTVSYPLGILTEGQYSDILVKTVQAIPTGVWPLENMPNVQLTFYPVPISGLTLMLSSVKALSSFPALTTAVSLPDGYEDYLALELCEALAPEYEQEVPQTVMERLKRLRRNIAKTNLVVPILKAPQDLTRRPFNILTNQP